MARWIGGVGMTFLAGVVGAALFVMASPSEAAKRGVMMARNGMVASINPLASEVGVHILRQGGNAIDAAIAVAAVLNVVDAPMTGIGGDAFILVYSAREGKVRALNASGRSPYGATREFFVRKGMKTIPPDSIYAVNTPGALDGWTELLKRYGTMPLEKLLGPAIELAEKGFPINEAMMGWYRIPLKDPLTQSIFYIGGKPPKLGQVLVQKQLAETFRQIARGGRDAFYRGESAKEIAAFAKSKGGFLSEKDFADHKFNWVEPISTTYRGYTVYEFPPNTQGLALLQQLNLLEGFDLKALQHQTADRIHIQVEAKKLAFADRDKFITDPDFASIPVKGLLSKAYAQERRKLINLKEAAKEVAPGDPTLYLGSNTTYFAVVDREGNAVSFINSIRNPWGTGLVGGKTGVLLQNRGIDFSLDEKHVNRYEPHKRSFHTIQPAMVFKGDKPFLILGASGAYQQTQVLAQLIVNIIDFGMSVQDAIEAPRWTHLSGVDMSLEHEFPSPVRLSLSRRGHHLLSEYRPGVLWGAAQIIMIDPETGTYMGGSESRSSGAAVGY